jgi:small-conductance mechanosensitive channel
MLQVADEHPKALKDPLPNLFFVGFGDSSLNFELAVWSAELTTSPRRFRSDLFFAIEKKLRENNIEIPFPQRDLRLRTDVPVNLRSGTTENNAGIAPPPI